MVLNVMRYSKSTYFYFCLTNAFYVSRGRKVTTRCSTISTHPWVLVTRVTLSARITSAQTSQRSTATATGRKTKTVLKCTAEDGGIGGSDCFRAAVL